MITHLRSILMRSVFLILFNDKTARQREEEGRTSLCRRADRCFSARHDCQNDSFKIPSQEILVDSLFIKPDAKE